MTKSLNGIASVIDRFDALLLDLWGVIHDGSSLYPQVKDTLTRLRSEGKKIIFLSNAPRRAARVITVLEALGIDASLYDAVVTSGEAGFTQLAHRKAGAYIFIGPDRDADVLDGLSYRRVENIQEAQFILNAGFGTEAQSDDAFDELLNAALQHKLPMVCLNPDLEVVKITGERYSCAGVIARAYAGMGGKVEWFGKPYPAVYEHCFSLLGGIDRSRIVAIGDGLETDILGANRAGLASVLVAGGILKDRGGEEVMRLCAAGEATPDYLIPALGW